MPYEDYLPKTLPPPLRGPWGSAFHAGVGQRMDSIAEDYRQAVFARLPGICPNDALDLIGRDRQLARGPGETDDAYRARLVDAWSAWAGDNTPISGSGGGEGSPLGLLRQLAIAGLPTGSTFGPVIVQQNGRFAKLDNLGGLVLGTLMTCANRMDLWGNVNPRPGWTFDGRDNFYSVFGIVFPVAGPPVDGGQLNTIVKQWKPSKAIYVGAWILDFGSVVLGWPNDNARTLALAPPLGGNTFTYLPPPDGEASLIGYTPST